MHDDDYAYDAEEDEQDYDAGYRDAMWHDVDWRLYKRFPFYALGVDDAEEYLYDKYIREQWRYAGWF